MKKIVWIVVVVVVIILALIGILFATGVINDENIQMYQTSKDVVEEGEETLEKAFYQITNSQLEFYQGKISGRDTKDLIRKVHSINEQGMFPEEVTIHYESSADILLNEDTISTRGIYEVSFEYSDEGYISTAIIKDLTSTETISEDNEEINVSTVEE